MITPYSKITTVDMWTDPYISKQMLKYHLDKQNDIASRNGQTISKTVDFISSYIKDTKTICDFGCGPGLYTNLLQKKGHKVIGVDVSVNSLEYAKNNNINVEYLQLNYVDEQVQEKLDAAMMIYCDFGALPPMSQVKFLSNLKSSLKNNGLFFFDVFTHKRFDDIKESMSTQTQQDGFFMEGNCTITHKCTKYEKLKLTLNHDKAEGYKTVELFNWDKHYEINEMKVLLNDNGFEVVDVYSDTMGNKDFSSNDLFFFVCKKVSK